MLIDTLKQKFPEFQNLRVRDIRVDKNEKRVFCVVSFPEVNSLDGAARNSLRAEISSQMPKGYKSEVSFVNDKFTDRSLVVSIRDYIKINFPLFANTKYDKISVKMQDYSAEVTFSVDQFTKRNMELAEFIPKISEYFLSYTCYKIKFFVVVDKNISVGSDDIESQETMVRLSINKEMLKPQRYFDITDVDKQIGKEINAKPMYISDIRAPMDSCVICGKISEKEIRAVKNNAILKLCKFNLTDDSGATMPCLMFVRFQIEDAETIKATTGKPDSEVKTISDKQRAANDKKMKKLAFLCDGTEVVVRGKVVYSQFSQRLELQMYDISRCKIQPIDLQPKFEREAPEKYRLIFPTPIEEFRQMTIMQHDEKPSVLANTECVVLYANATGYNVTGDKIFAVCGIKLVNGHMKEKFYTPVLPEIELTEEQLKSAELTLKQLNLSPTITEIIEDLYKFVCGCVLIGEHIEQLIPVLNYYAAPLGFNFKNKTASVTYTLQRLFENSSVESRPSYSQWNEVAKVLKLEYHPSDSCQTKAEFASQCISLLADKAR